MLTMWSHTIYDIILSQPLALTLTHTLTHTHALIKTFKQTNHHRITISHLMTAPDALSSCQTVMFHDCVCAPNSQHSSVWVNLLSVTPQQTLTLDFPSAHRPQDKHVPYILSSPQRDRDSKLNLHRFRFSAHSSLLQIVGSTYMKLKSCDG